MAVCRSGRQGIEACWPHARFGLLFGAILFVSNVDRGASQFEHLEQSYEADDEDDETFLGESLEAIFDAAEFEDKIMNMVNYSETDVKPEYYPTVLFHVSWCKHCHAATKELNRAAAKVRQELRTEKRKPIPPKFFTVQCDSRDKDMKKICVRYVGSNFPSLILFRQHRELRYGNRPRKWDVYKWWVKRMLRPFLNSVENKKHLHKIGEPTFILKADNTKSKYVEMWQELAHYHMEECTFAITKPTSEIGVKMPSDEPSIQMYASDGAGLTPIPFTGVFQIPELKKWVAINLMPMLVKSEEVYFDMLRRNDVPTVVLIHSGGKKGRRHLAVFATYIKNIRPRGGFAFMALDASEETDKKTIYNDFPLLIPQVAEYPRIIIFQGNTYWEDPALDEISKATPEALQGLMENDDARQTGETIDWFKEKWKIYLRFANKSLQNTLLALVMPVLFVFLFWKLFGPIITSFCTSDDEDDEDDKKAKQTNGSDDGPDETEEQEAEEKEADEKKED
mmetsp:Transcript_31937/g.56356  ORF Transcript_31937/g.56356 Transcript_31937/m.56356 type:complete len:508 (-) Transcript_31937:111-1634(-)